jgi:urea transport system ATP-binding protein
MDIITGKTRPDSGTVFFGSTIDLLRYSEPQIAHFGIGRKFQKPTVFEHLSVFENLELALKTNKSVWPSMRFKLDSAQQDKLGQMLHTIHLAQHVTQLAMARNRDAPDARPKAATARRACRRHDGRRNRPHG